MKSSIPFPRSRQIAKLATLAVVGMLVLLTAYWATRRAQIDPRFVGTWNVSWDDEKFLMLDDDGYARFRTQESVSRTTLQWWVKDGWLRIDRRRPFGERLKLLFEQLRGRADDRPTFEFSILEVHPERIQLRYSSRWALDDSDETVDTLTRTDPSILTKMGDGP